MTVVKIKNFSPVIFLGHFFWSVILLSLASTELAANAPAAPSATPSTAPSNTPTAEPTAQPSKEDLAAVDTADFIRSCKSNFHLPFLRKILFSLDGLQFWATLPILKPSTDDARNPLNQPGERKLITYAMDVSSSKAIPIFGLRNNLYADLITTLDPMGRATSTANVILSPGDSQCARGKFELISGVESSKGPIKKTGIFGIVPHFRTPVIFEPLSRKLLLLDTKTMQSRKLGDIPTGLHPVYADPIKGLVTTWNSPARSLKSESLSGAKRTKKIRVRPGQQVLQVDGRFAAIGIATTSNSATIHEMANWTKVTRNGKYQFKLPVRYSISQALVVPNFDRKIAIVTARESDVQRNWQKAFLVDYKSDKIIREFTAPGTDFFSAAGISPNAKHVVLIQANGKTSTAQKVLVFDLSKETISEISLPSP